MGARTRTSIAVLALLIANPVFGGDQVSNWNSIMLSTVAGQNPFAQARFAAITQLAVFEAVNAITRHHNPYLGITASTGASAEAAAVAAAHTVLKNYFPGSGTSLDAARVASLATIPDGPSKTSGIGVGEAAAAAMIALRANDGSATPLPYTPFTDPGFWQPTPPAFAPAALLHWAKVTPFGLASGSQFRSEPPPALNSGRYRRDYDEVKEVGDVNSTQRPQDRADVARYFAATSAMHAWNQAAAQVSATQGTSLSHNARTLAVLNMAINDGLIASIETKYFYHFWRPVTAIRAGDTDGNPRTGPDPAFTPFITTPAFPSYPSAHASASYAAREVLERIYGRGPHSITLSNPALPGMTLNYSTFRQITDDVDDARVYGGIHFRFDQDAGALQGQHVGRYVNKNHLRCAKGDNYQDCHNDE